MILLLFFREVRTITRNSNLTCFQLALKILFCFTLLHEWSSQEMDTQNRGLLGKGMDTRNSKAMEAMGTGAIEEYMKQCPECG
jgi:hypothetical protein